MKKYIYFYDLNEKLLARYPAKISQEILSTHQDAEFVYLYSERYEKKGNPDKLPEGSKVVYLPTLSMTKIQKLFKTHPPALFITIGMRLPDILMLSFFNRHQVPTCMVQHGLFIKHLERIPLHLVIGQKLIKFTQYLIYSYKISRVLKKSFLKTLYELYLYFIKGSHKIPQLKHINSSLILAKTAFIFDDNWKKYYFITYGYTEEQFYKIGNPDFLILKQLKSAVQENAVCYICQSLVEDGRYLRSDFMCYIKEIEENLADDIKVYFKMHPRSRMELYEELNTDKINFTQEFPNCKFYLGHYSSLLAVAHDISQVIIWNLKGHQTPAEYVKYADMISNDWEEVRSFIRIKQQDNTTKDFDASYMEDSFNPYYHIAQFINQKATDF
ncbi:hypothetical protein Clim_1880 [Chlorobium limicola DSM 245]|uniref:CDP-glycerol:poly(Glycerophosphate) glycerophosphotransferase n=1 Tax=Chlorobium limicola (strain DSM 245 / NBRC 103803 / 6330) TaxID=290315 RepID=B3EF53_CHLL2|nr:polysialyltransferase family glycosyltransferase [Chlorobium limicola]ACD90915.1 hypothetical protein Clim_1880 [Chlorobium limicola DSM 245]